MADTQNMPVESGTYKLTSSSRSQNFKKRLLTSGTYLDKNIDVEITTTSATHSKVGFGDNDTNPIGTLTLTLDPTSKMAQASFVLTRNSEPVYNVSNEGWIGKGNLTSDISINRTISVDLTTKDTDLKAENIKSGVTIFGVTGTLKSTAVDSADYDNVIPDNATLPDGATQWESARILAGYEAYDKNAVRIVGTMNNLSAGTSGSLTITKPDSDYVATLKPSSTGYVTTNTPITATIPTETKTVKSTTTSQTISPTSGKLIGSITVTPWVLQEKEVSASGTFTPGSGVDAFSKVIVKAGSEGTPSSGFASSETPYHSGSETPSLVTKQYFKIQPSVTNGEGWIVGSTKNGTLTKYKIDDATIGISGGGLTLNEISLGDDDYFLASGTNSYAITASTSASAAAATYTVSKSGWVNKDKTASTTGGSDSTSKTRYLKAGSEGTPSSGYSELSSAPSGTLTPLNTQYFKIQPSVTNTKGWITGSTKTASLVNYKVKDTTASPALTKTESASALTSPTSVDSQYFKIKPYITPTSTTSGWLGSTINGTEISYKVKNGSASVSSSASVSTNATTYTPSQGDVNGTDYVTITATPGISKGTISAGWMTTNEISTSSGNADNKYIKVYKGEFTDLT